MTVTLCRSFCVSAVYFHRSKTESQKVLLHDPDDIAQASEAQGHPYSVIVCEVLLITFLDIRHPLPIGREFDCVCSVGIRHCRRRPRVSGRIVVRYNTFAVVRDRKASHLSGCLVLVPLVSFDLDLDLHCWESQNGDANRGPNRSVPWEPFLELFDHDWEGFGDIHVI